MIWWVVILSLSAATLVWVGAAFYLRIRKQMQTPGNSTESAETVRREIGTEE